MFGIGTEELMLILVIALVVLGPERMPKLARDLGKMVGEFRKTSDDLRNFRLGEGAVGETQPKGTVCHGATIIPAPTETWLASSMRIKLPMVRLTV